MTIVRCYLYREKVVVPTVNQTDAGFFLDGQPVQVLDFEDKQSLRSLLKRTFETPNPIVPTPDGSQVAGSVILDKLSLQKWSSFEKSAVMYTIFLGGPYTKFYASGRGADGMWSESDSSERLFHPSLSKLAIAELLLEDMGSRPEARSERFSLAIIPKKNT